MTRIFCLKTCIFCNYFHKCKFKALKKRHQEKLENANLSWSSGDICSLCSHDFFCIMLANCREKNLGPPPPDPPRPNSQQWFLFQVSSTSLPVEGTSFSCNASKNNVPVVCDAPAHQCISKKCINFWCGVSISLYVPVHYKKCIARILSTLQKRRIFRLGNGAFS